MNDDSFQREKRENWWESAVLEEDSINRQIEITQIEYPIFRKIREKIGKAPDLYETKKILSKIREPLAKTVLEERKEEWR